MTITRREAIELIDECGLYGDIGGEDMANMLAATDDDAYVAVTGGVLTWDGDGYQLEEG